jgi:hypothetical protein
MTRLRGSQQATVWPPTAITRFTKSFSSGGASPISDPTACSARSTGFAVSSTVNSLLRHVSGPRKTRTSPGSGPRKR